MYGAAVSVMLKEIIVELFFPETSKTVILAFIWPALNWPGVKVRFTQLSLVNDWLFLIK